MFVDASAICAALLREPDGDRLYQAMTDAPGSITTAMAIWESVLAVARAEKTSPSDALQAVNRFVSAAGVQLVAVPPEAADLAVEAYDRFGKGRHPAALNFGDCFAYACARHFGMPLLYKGDDFPRTDIEASRLPD